MHSGPSIRGNANIAIILLAALLMAGPAAAGLLMERPDLVKPLGTEQFNGSELWEARYDGPASGWDWGHDIAVHPLGILVYVTGESAGAGTGADYTTIAYEAATGLPVWTARYDGPASGPDAGRSIAVDPVGLAVYVTGTSRGATGSGIATIAYNALTGLELWVARHDGLATGPEETAAVALSPDGERVYVTGTIGSWSNGRFTTIAYDAETGDELWAATFIGPGAGGDEAQDIVVAPDGSRVYVTGWAHLGGYTAFDYATVAYDAETGAELWSALYTGPADEMEFSRAIDITPDGGLVLITGGSIGIGTNFDITTVAYNAATGAEVWVARYDGPASSSDSAWDLEISPDGTTVFVTGFSWGVGTGLDYVTLAYDTATGDQKWLQRFNGPSNASDFASALAVSIDGMRVYVTGYTWHGSNFQYGTVAYDTGNGSESWVAHYNGPAGSDFASAIAVDPLSLRVYVTGGSQGQGTGNDIATVAFLDLR